MMKSKKNQTLSASGTLNGIVPVAEKISFSDLVHCTTSNLRDLGFRQIVLPPLSEKKLFSDNGVFSRIYRDKLIDVENIRSVKAVFPPTHLLNVYQLYLDGLLEEQQENSVAKWFHISPIFIPGEDGKQEQIKYELGIYILGSSSPLAYSQLINASLKLAENVGMPNVEMTLNSVGCGQCQEEYFKLLYNHLKPGAQNLCDKCGGTIKSQIKDFSIFGCGQDSCQQVLSEAPQLIDYLDDGCRQELIGVLETMDELQIPYALSPTHAFDPLIQRIGFRLDYIGEDKKDVLGEGGSYSHFSRYFGRDDNVPVLGFSTTLDKLSLYINPEDLLQRSKTEVFVIPVGDLAARKALTLYEELRQADIQVREAMLLTSGIKKQLQIAQRHRPILTLIIGQKEAMDDMVILRDMQSSMQEVFTHDRIVEEVKKRLGR